MIRFYLIISLIFTIPYGYGQNQDLKFGVSGSSQLVQRTRFTAAEYNPSNSSYVYLEPSEGAGIIDQSHVFNGFSLGTIISYTFRKSTLSIEPQYFMQRSVFKFEQVPYSERVVGMRAFRVPIFYSFRLFKKKNSMFLAIGSIFTAAKNYDFQHAGSGYLFSNGPIYNGGVDFGDDHFESILYSNDVYWQNFLAIGKNIGDFKLTFRFISRSPKSNEKIVAEIGQMEMCLSYHIFGVSDFKKKRSIYHE